MDSRKTSQETTVQTEVRGDEGLSRGSDRGLEEVDSGVRNGRQMR